MVVQPLAAHLVGQASRRGLIPRVPTADRLLADTETWLTATQPDLVRSIRRSGPVVGEDGESSGEARLAAALHPAARDLVLVANDAGRVAADADTVALGPGYHRFVGRLLERLETDLEVSWGRVHPDRPDEADPWAGVTFADRATTERAYLGWLGKTLVGARAARANAADPVHIGTPDGVRYAVDAAIATALGPRDDAWIERAIADT